MIRRALAALLASLAGSLMGRAVRLAGAPPAPPPPARIVPADLDLRDVYDVLACEALDRWNDGQPFHAEIGTVEALDRARRLTARGALLSDRRGAC